MKTMAQLCGGKLALSESCYLPSTSGLLHSVLFVFRLALTEYPHLFRPKLWLHVALFFLLRQKEPKRRLRPNRSAGPKRLTRCWASSTLDVWKYALIFAHWVAAIELSYFVSVSGILFWLHRPCLQAKKGARRGDL
jgi:hypothetical protein